MEAHSCFVCGFSLSAGDTVYGLSRGNLSENCNGFEVDDTSAWDLLCDECMNAVDQLIFEFKKSN